MHDYKRLLNPSTAVQLLGTAITVKAPIGDNLFYHEALDLAQPGDNIVVMEAVGVPDPLPVYAKGVTPQRPFKIGPGEVNTPIACGEQVVFPGDILVGDKNEIVVIRRQGVEAVAEVALKKKDSENKIFKLMRSDINAYAAKHLQTTEKRMEGKNVELMTGSYVGC